MAKLEPALSMVFTHEGGLVDNPNDSGSITNLGISFRFYKKKVKPDSTPDDIKNLTVNDAAEIYRRFWWERYPFSEIDSQLICNRLFDLSVNLGSAAAISCLQRAIDACLGCKLVVDGMLGPKTLAATNLINEQNLYDQLIIQAELKYRDIVYHNPKDQLFLNGWLARLKN